jgi:hypothetical protein
LDLKLKLHFFKVGVRLRGVSWIFTDILGAFALDGQLGVQAYISEPKTSWWADGFIRRVFITDAMEGALRQSYHGGTAKALPQSSNQQNIAY